MALLTDLNSEQTPIHLESLASVSFPNRKGDTFLSKNVTISLRFASDE